MASSSLPTTRVCFKNLPKNATTDNLRKHIDNCGSWNITDVKVVKRRDGVSRRFAFVGFHTHEDASKAIKFFDKTFFNTSRLKVEEALPVGDKHLPRAWSRHTVGTTAYNKSHGITNNNKYNNDNNKNAAGDGDEKDTNNTGEKIDEEKSKKFKEFLDIMKPRTKGNKWSNDGIIPENSKEVSTEGNNYKNDADNESSSDEEYEDLKNDPSETKEKKSKMKKEKKNKTKKKKKKKDLVKHNKEVSDMDYLMTKVSKNEDDDSSSSSGSSSSSSSSDSDSDSSSSSDNSSSSSTSDSSSESDTEDLEDEKAKNKSNKKDNEDEPVEETGRLFIRNIPFSTTEEELREIFQPHGALTEVHIPLDDNQRSRGFGYVTFVVPECAVMAMSILDGNIFQGRLLHILPGRRAIDPDQGAADDDDENNEGGTSGYKKKQEQKAKEAANDDSNWNPVYIRADTAVSSLAERFNMKKGDILDTQASNMAVRVALGEAHVLAETKQFLVENGVSTDALDNASKGFKVKRSKSIILVKNLPADTDVPELRQMFSKHGEINRFVVPPTKVMALVEYFDKLNAKRAFRSLAYKRYKRVPLYLEWAPENSFVKAAIPPKAANQEANDSGNNDGDIGSKTNSSNSTLSNSIFVKNLNFDTSENGLKKHFEAVAPVRSVKIPRKGTNKELSMGFGFVEFSSIQDAQKAMKRLQHSTIDGHSVELKLSMQGNNRNKTIKGGNKRKVLRVSNATGTKLLVKNLAFEATRNDLRELFGAFGQIKSVRIPRKFDGGTRGFGFIDFLTHDEALNCLNALTNAHLYGRRLVLDWAEETEYDDNSDDDNNNNNKQERKKLKTS